MKFIPLRDLLSNAIKKVGSNIQNYSRHPGRDFSRKRKLPVETLIAFLVAQGSGPLRDELIDYFGAPPDTISVQALCQQRNKLDPEALRQTFLGLTSSAYAQIQPEPYQFLAADGSTFTFASKPCFSPQEYHTRQGGADGSYGIHLNAMYDLGTGLYTDGVIQPASQKDEFRAFCTMVDRHRAPAGSRAVFIGDRGYCSYNNMAHVTEAGQFFLFRCKDVGSKGPLFSLGLPADRPADDWVTYSLVRTMSKEAIAGLPGPVRYVTASTSFDYVAPGSGDVYRLPFRIVRFRLDNGAWECVVTNLPQDEFPPDRVRQIHGWRWGIETGFRKLKHTLGTLSFHAYKPKLVMQEVWAGLAAYNLTSLAVAADPVDRKGGRKHDYAINFSAAAHIMRQYLRGHDSVSDSDLLRMLARYLIPLRPDRHFQRLQTAHFRRPKYILYRPA